MQGRNHRLNFCHEAVKVQDSNLEKDKSNNDKHEKKPLRPGFLSLRQAQVSWTQTVAHGLTDLVLRVRIDFGLFCVKKGRYEHFS